MKAVKALLQFTTILPLGKPADFDCFAAHSWLYPIAGYITGLIAAIPALIFWLCGFENSLSKYCLLSGPRLNRRSMMLRSEANGILSINTWEYGGKDGVEVFLFALE